MIRRKSARIVTGPEDVFVSVLADITLMAKDLRDARAIAARILENPPVVEPADT